MKSKKKKIKLIDVSGSCMGKVVVHQMNIEFSVGKKNVIIGESGSGKSTLLKMIAGLFEVESGKIMLDDERIKGPNEKLIPGHPEIAYIGQYAELKNNYRVSEFLSYENECTDAENETLYEHCNISHLLERWTDELSGGEKQRVAIAKLLANRPSVLILDEPFSHLDNFHKKTLVGLVDNLCRQYEVGCILVSHDARDVLSWADQIFVMKEGEVIHSGTPEVIYHLPENIYTARLLGEYMILKPDEDLCLKLNLPLQNIGKQFLIRPSYFSIEKKGEGAVTVSIHEMLFYGDYFLIKARYGRHDFLLRNNDAVFSVGEEIDISLKSIKLHEIANAD